MKTVKGADNHYAVDDRDIGVVLLTKLQRSVEARRLFGLRKVSSSIIKWSSKLIFVWRDSTVDTASHSKYIA